MWGMGTWEVGIVFLILFWVWRFSSVLGLGKANRGF